VFGWVTRPVAGGKAWVRRQQDEREWVDHLFRAGSAYKSNNGDYLAAGVTYYSFLSLFPLVLVGVSIAGFVLSSRQDLRDRLNGSITDSLPGDFGDTVVKAVNTAVENRGTVGIIALVGLAYAGLGWIGNLRKAVMIIWDTDHNKQPNPVMAKLGDLLALAGLGLATLLSLALTATVTAATGWLVAAVGLDDVTGIGVFTHILGLLIAAVGDTLVFGWLLARLPRVGVPYGSVLKGAVLAAVGFGVLKVVGTYYISHVSNSPTAGVFGSVIGILVWMNLVSRYVLFAAAWTATDLVFTEGILAPLLGLATEDDIEEAHEVLREPSHPRPVTVAGALLGTGAVVGAAVQRRFRGGGSAGGRWRAARPGGGPGSRWRRHR
jgi:membrane protein